jgi:hypothetical protein
MMNLNPKTVHSIHLAFVAPLLLYTGYTLKQGRKLPNGVPQLLAATGAAALVYHGYHAYQKTQKGQSLVTSYGLQTNTFHLLLVAPLIAYTGYQLMQNQKPQKWQTTALVILGGGALLHHALQLMRK